MRISSSHALALLIAGAAVWSASAASCATIGSGCIRNSDCSSDQICMASTCQIDPGSVEPQEAGLEAEVSLVAESSAADSSTLPEPIDSSSADAEAAPADTSVIVPSPDANSSDVSTDSADAADAPSEADTPDSTSDAASPD